MTKVLMVVYGAVLIGLGIAVYLQSRAITKLTAQAVGNQNANTGNTADPKRTGNSSAPFGEMVDAVKDKIKTLKIEATTTA